MPRVLVAYAPGPAAYGCWPRSSAAERPAPARLGGVDRSAHPAQPAGRWAGDRGAGVRVHAAGIARSIAHPTDRSWPAGPARVRSATGHVRSTHTPYDRLRPQLAPTADA